MTIKQLTPDKLIKYKIDGMFANRMDQTDGIKVTFMDYLGKMLDQVATLIGQFAP